MINKDKVFTQGFWEKRIGSVSFWVGLIAAIAAPVLAAAGMDWADVTSWPALWSVVVNALASPATVVAMLMAAWTAINNPTTNGFGDETPTKTTTDTQAVAAENAAAVEENKEAEDAAAEKEDK